MASALVEQTEAQGEAEKSEIPLITNASAPRSEHPEARNDNDCSN